MGLKTQDSPSRGDVTPAHMSVTYYVFSNPALSPQRFADFVVMALLSAALHATGQTAARVWWYPVSRNK